MQSPTRPTPSSPQHDSKICVPAWRVVKLTRADDASCWRTRVHQRADALHDVDQESKVIVTDFSLQRGSALAIIDGIELMNVPQPCRSEPATSGICCRVSSCFSHVFAANRRACSDCPGREGGQ
jgi:hypothetical protein